MIQKSNRRKSRVNRGQLLNPNDPRWDIQIGIPVSRLVQILACEKGPSQNAGRGEKS